VSARRRRSGRAGGEEERNALRALAFRSLAVKLGALQEFQQRASAELQRLSMADVMTHTRGWVCMQLEAIGGSPQTETQAGESHPFMEGLSESLAILSQGQDDLDKAALDPWYLEAQAIEAVRLGLDTTGIVYPHSGVAGAAVVLHQIALYRRLFAGLHSIRETSVVQLAASAASCTRFVLDVVRTGTLSSAGGGHTPCCDGDACRCQIALQAMLTLLDRVAQKIQSSTSDHHCCLVEVGRLRLLQAEVALMYRGLGRAPCTPHLNAEKYTAQALAAWRSHLGFDTLVNAVDADAVAQSLVSASKSGGLNLVCYLSDAGHLLELLSLPAEAGEALVLALVSLGDLWWLPGAPTTVSSLSGACSHRMIGLQLLYRLVAASARAAGQGVIAVGHASSRRWWALAEAARERLLLALTTADTTEASNEMCLFALAIHRLEAAAVLPTVDVSATQAASALHRAWIQARTVVMDRTGTKDALATVSALQVSAEWCAQWGGGGGVAGQCAALNAMELLKRCDAKSISPTPTSLMVPTAAAVQGWPMQRCILLRLRVLLQLGISYELFGEPKLAGYYYETGLLFMSQVSCGAPRYRMKFLCGRARLACAGVPVRAVAASQTSTSSPSDLERCAAAPLEDLKTVWSQLQDFDSMCECEPARSGSMESELSSLMQLHRLQEAPSAAQLATSIPVDAAAPMHSFTCHVLLDAARSCARLFWQGFLEHSAIVASRDIAKLFAGCVAMLEAASADTKQSCQRAAMRSALIRVGGTCRCSSSAKDVVRNLEDALVLSIGVLQMSVSCGHAVVARLAAQQVVSLTHDTVKWMLRGATDPPQKCNQHLGSRTVCGLESCAALATASSGLSLRSRSATARVRSRSRSPSRHGCEECFDETLDSVHRVCSVAVPMCSGVTVFVLNELRALQRALAGDVGETLRRAVGVSAEASELPFPGSPDAVSKFCTGGWLAELPGQVAVAWLQYDRDAQVLRISRRGDGPKSHTPGCPMISQSVPLAIGLFETLEAELNKIFADNERTITEHMHKPDRNSDKGKVIYWRARSMFDLGIGKVARRFEDEALREWRFLLSPWPRDGIDAFLGLEAWLASEALLAHFSLGGTCRWLLALLYLDADSMEEVEISSVMGAVFPRSLTASQDDLRRLGASLREHRLMVAGTACQWPRRTPLLLFVDSAVAQIPIESCSCLRQREVARAVAPNIALGAFERLSACRDSGFDPNGGQRRSPAQWVPRGLRNGYYVLDPNGDTSFAGSGLRALLTDWSGRASGCENATAWTGSIGKPGPSSAEMANMLGSRDAFVYMGHGQAARAVLKMDSLQLGTIVPQPKSTVVASRPTLRPLQSVTLLMGCSSAKAVHVGGVAEASATWPNKSSPGYCGVSAERSGQFEAFAMPWHLLIGGSPAVIGALWDILGADLDAVACALLKGWASDGAAGMLSSLVNARSKCMMRNLTGAAVVCYGVPV